MDSSALPVFLGFVSGLFLLFCCGAVFTSAAAIRLAATTLRLPAASWRKLLPAGLLCAAVHIAFFLTVQSETLGRLDLAWETAGFLALIGSALVCTYLRDLFDTSRFRILLLAALGLAVFTGTCALGAMAASLVLKQM